MFENKTVLVGGGTGSVGEGIVRAFLEAGARVVVPSRTQENIEALKTRLGSKLAQGLVGIEGDVASFAGTESLASIVRDRVGGIDHAVASIVNGWFSGKTVARMSEAEWNSAFVGNILPHFAFARAFTPMIAEGGSYTVIAGLSAEMSFPGMSAMNMFGAALFRLREVLAAEWKGRLRVNDLTLGYIISRNRPDGEPSWLNADDVGRMTVEIASNYSFDNMHIRVPEQSDLAKYLPA